MAKSVVRYLNRAFRKSTAHWVGHPKGFKTVREQRSWCRMMAITYSDTDIGQVFEDVTPTQGDWDEAVQTEMSYWE